MHRLDRGTGSDMKTVLFLSFDKNFGLTFHFADWVITLDKLAENKLKMFFVTLNKEQAPGLLSKVTGNLANNPIILNDPAEIAQLNFLGDIDIVHCHGFGQVSQILKIKKANNFKFKIINTIHSFRNGTRYGIVYANLFSLFCNKINAVHFLSHKAKNEFLRFNPIYKRSNRSFVFPLGCDAAEFSRDEPIDHLEFFEELRQRNKNIVYLAKFVYGKRHLCLLETLKEVLIKEDARLWLLGSKGPESERVMRYVHDNDLSHYVKFPGHVERRCVPTVLKHMNVAVCSSKSETFGHVLLEPMFAGIPVVTFDVGIASFLIRDFTNGFVIRNKSEKVNFARCVEYLLRNKDAAAAMGNNNREFASQQLNWDVHCQNCVDMYQCLINEDE